MLKLFDDLDRELTHEEFRYVFDQSLPDYLYSRMTMRHILSCYNIKKVETIKVFYTDNITIQVNDNLFILYKTKMKWIHPCDHQKMLKNIIKNDIKGKEIIEKSCVMPSCLLNIVKDYYSI